MTTASVTMGEFYVKAMENTRRYVKNVGPDQWSNPTPCSEWDTRQLVGHITGENFWAGELFRGKTIPEVGDRLDGDLLGGDPVAAYNRSVEVAREAALAPGAMEATTHLSFGDFPGSEYAKQLFLDLLVHGWDVAKATGQDARLSPELVEACIPVAEEMTGMVGDGGPYGSRLELPPDATSQDKLLALLGRNSNWRP